MSVAPVAAAVTPVTFMRKTCLQHGMVAGGVLIFEPGVDVTKPETLRRPDLWQGVQQAGVSNALPQMGFFPFSQSAMLAAEKLLCHCSLATVTGNDNNDAQCASALLGLAGES